MRVDDTAGAADGPDDVPSVVDARDVAIPTLWRWQPFPPEQEAAFLVASGAETLQVMRANLLLTAALGVAMTGASLLSGAEFLGISLILELMINLPIALGGAWILPRIGRVAAREAVFAAAAAVRVASITFESHWASLAYADRYAIAGALALYFALLLVPLRLLRAACLAAIVFPVYLLAALTPFDAAAQVNCGTLAFAWVLPPVGLRGRWRIERAERRAFLLSERDRQRVRDLARANERLHALSNTDPLTGAGNRRHFDRALARAVESGGALALLMLDADHFKRFNDAHGHPMGDECLRQLAHAMREEVRAPDLVARYGGEEFAIVLHGAHASDAVRIAERVRCRVEALALPHENRPDAARIVTLSIGVATRAESAATSPEALTADADAALYAAKEAGRNRVAVHGAHSRHGGETVSMPVPLPVQ